jgi:hypothetical protein
MRSSFFIAQVVARHLNHDGATLVLRIATCWLCYLEMDVHEIP